MKKFFCGIGAAGLTTSAYFHNRSTQDTKEISANQWVTVYVWKSKRASGDITTAPKAVLKIKIKHENANVGHVSLQTSNNNYVSFWPATSGQIKEPVQGTYMSNIEKDITNEGALPDVIARFYSLNFQEIETQLQNLQKNTDGWALKGPVKQNECRGHSCASYVCSILEAGEISRLTPANRKIVSSDTPNNVADLVIAAQAAERKRYPITVKWEKEQKFQMESNNTSTMGYRH